MATKGGKSSSTEQEKGKESLRARLEKAHLERTKDGDSDRESCASHRSQDSLDLDADLERISNMGGSQRDLRSLASPEDLEREPEPSEPEQNDYPVTVEVTLQDCQGEPPPPHHLVGQQYGEPELCVQGLPEVRIEEAQKTDDADVTVTCDEELTHSCDQELEVPEEGDANRTLQECPPDQTTAATHTCSPIPSNQGIGTEEDTPASVGPTPDVSQQGSQEPLLHQGRPETDTRSQDSEHSKSHGNQAQEIAAIDVKCQEQPLPTDEDSHQQDWKVKEELAVSVEAAPYQVDEPVAMVSWSVYGYFSEKSDHQTCWKGKIVSEDGLLELEGDSGRSVKYPPLMKRIMSTDPNSPQATTNSEQDLGTLTEETSAGPQPDDLITDEERPEPLVAPTKATKEKQLGSSIPVVVNNGSGVVVLKRDWRVQTINDGTALQFDWNDSLLLNPSPRLCIPGAAMV